MKQGITLCSAAMAVLLACTAQGAVIDPANVTYTYSPQGIQPTSHVPPITDGNLDTGDELANGVLTDWVGYNEGASGGGDNGKPQPGVDFHLGGQAYDLTQVSVVYEAGGGSAIMGPASVQIFYSTDGGATFSLTPDVTFTAFDRTDGSTVYDVATAIALAGMNVTDVRMNFYQGSSHLAGSAWVFLREVTFEGSAIPEPATMSLLALGGLAALLKRRRKA